MTGAEIVEYTNTFTQCYHQVMGVFSGDTRRKVEGEVMHFVSLVQPYVLFTGEGMKDAADRVFGSVEFRQMVFRLTNLFLSRLPNAYVSYMQIATQLAWAHDISGHGNEEELLVPEEITNRLMPFSEIANAILENKWLFTLLILMKVLQVDSTTGPGEGRTPIDTTRPARVVS